MNTIYGTAPADLPLPERVGQKLLLSYVPDDEVPKQHRSLVRTHVRRLAKRHQLGDVGIGYFGPARPNAVPKQMPNGKLFQSGDFFFTAKELDGIPGGIAPDDEPLRILLHHGIRGAEYVAFLIAHEIAHLIRRRAGAPPDETACDAFASRYVRQLRAR